MTAWTDLGLSLPVLAAPMAGGPTTPALVTAAAAAGTLGFLATGYKTPEAFGEEVTEVRRKTPTFGVNLFVPNQIRVDLAEYVRYRNLLRPEADRLSVVLPDTPLEDDDFWQAKVDLLVASPAPVVSFTFGVPDRPSIERLRRAGSVLVQTVTSVDEAKAAADSGVDMVAVQASAAGGHSGTFMHVRQPTPTALVDLVSAVRSAVGLPVIAAGGLASASAVASVLRAGAVAAMVGTVLLLSDESGASAAHQRAIAEGTRETVVTRAFTGRPARALRNAFIDEHDAVAPYGYPAIHHLTSPLRKAATAAGDPEQVNLWAGTGYRQATPEPAAAILNRLTPA